MTSTPAAPPHVVPSLSSDPYVAFYEMLLHIHRSLGGAFAELVAIDAADVERIVVAADGAGGFLVGHHDAESNMLFPALRESGVLRSSDVAFLDGLDREHHALHDLCGRLLAETKAPHPRAREILTLGREIAAAFALHVRSEEAGLRPERLRTMITPAKLAELKRAGEAAREAHAAKQGR